MSIREHRHWTDDEILAQVYGLDAASHPGCSECSARMARARSVFETLAQPPQAPERFFAAQRRRILERAACLAPRRPLTRFTSALAAAALLLAALLVQTPAPPPETIAETDSELLAEVYDEVTSPETESLRPIRILFDSTEQQ